MYESGEGVSQNHAEAAKWFRKAADQGSVYAQRDLAFIYYNGAEGVPQNFAEAAEWFRRAAEQGYDLAQSILGEMYSKGQGVPQNYILAYMWLSLSSAQSPNATAKLRGIVAAMTPEQIAQGQKLAREWKPAEDGYVAYRRGDYTTALRLIRPLAEQGDAQAQITMGIMYLEGGAVTKDYRKAVQWFRLAADRGNAEAQGFLGGIFHDGGNGVPQNRKEAAKWYRLAADQGDADAQVDLGKLYYDGDGITQDYKEAAKWFRSAADKGNSDGQMRLGFMYSKGEGVARDYREAMKWYRLAADQGNADAQFFLGNIYNEGKGVAQDYRESAKWHRLAAQQGMARAQLALGVEYYGGKEGVAQDYLYAYMWLSLAASKLDGVLGEVATRSRNGVAKEMTSAQVLAAQEMAKRCEGSNYKQCDKPEGSQSAISVPMQREGGAYVVPVLINDAITLDFVVDSGAADVSIPADVVMTLKRTGTLADADFQGEKKYKLADGLTVPSQTFQVAQGWRQGRRKRSWQYRVRKEQSVIGTELSWSLQVLVSG